MTRVLKAGSEFLALFEVRRVMQAARKAARDSLEVIELLDAKVREFTEYNSRADQNEIREQIEAVVLLI